MLDDRYSSGHVATMQAPSNEAVFEGIHCRLTIRRPRPGVVLAIFKGTDVGEFGQAPFQELAKDLATSKQIEMFVDARAVPQASLDVSNDWAQWMIANNQSLLRINMLCATPFVQLTAKIVRNFTALGERMRIYTDASEFEKALGAAIVGNREG
jgi:hypothetical protein